MKHSYTLMNISVSREAFLHHYNFFLFPGNHSYNVRNTLFPGKHSYTVTNISVSREAFLHRYDYICFQGSILTPLQMCPFSAKRSCVVEVEQPWGDTTVERNLPALKFTHDFSSGTDQNVPFRHSPSVSVSLLSAFNQGHINL